MTTRPKFRVEKTFDVVGEDTDHRIAKAIVALCQSLDPVLEAEGLSVSALFQGLGETSTLATFVFRPALRAAPNHSEAKAEGLRFRHFHDANGRLRGTAVVEEVHGSLVKQVRAVLTAVNPIDRDCTRAAGRDRAYTRLREWGGILMDLTDFKAELKAGTLAATLAKRQGGIPVDSMRGVR